MRPNLNFYAAHPKSGLFYFSADRSRSSASFAVIPGSWAERRYLQRYSLARWPHERTASPKLFWLGVHLLERRFLVFFVVHGGEPAVSRLTRNKPGSSSGSVPSRITSLKILRMRMYSVRAADSSWRARYRANLPSWSGARFIGHTRSRRSDNNSFRIAAFAA